LIEILVGVGGERSTEVFDRAQDSQNTAADFGDSIGIAVGRGSTPGGCLRRHPHDPRSVLWDLALLSPCALS
jgi:hypothetical protein